MLLLMESPLQPNRADDHHAGLAAAAQSLGHRVHVFPKTGGLAEAQPALTRGDFQWGVVFGESFTVERYQMIHDQARALNITLLNDPSQHRQAQEFDRAVTLLGELTARTEVVELEAEVEAALKRLPPPVFIRGSVSSAKELGWKACVADTLPEAQALVNTLLSRADLSRGRVLLREILPLRRLNKGLGGFPVSREYRLFVLDADVLGLGPCWVAEDPFGALTERDERELQALAHEAAKRTKVPWLVVDAGQLESGQWRIIETADPSSAELAAVNPRDLLSALANGLEQRAGC